MTLKPYDEARKFYASRLPHDWWPRVLERSNWASQALTIITPGAFPISGVQIAGVNPKRVAAKAHSFANINMTWGNGPFVISSALLLTSGTAWSSSTINGQNLYTLADVGRMVQLSWFVTQASVGQTFTVYFGELLCDVDPFDFDALYKD